MEGEVKARETKSTISEDDMRSVERSGKEKKYGGKRMEENEK
jgi:hypothetical protein